MNSEQSFDEQELIAAIDRLRGKESFEEAGQLISTVAPQLQTVLNEALTASDWFGEAHERSVLSAAGTADIEARLTAVKTLLAEETRLGMLVGATVGFALARELASVE